MKKIMIFLFFGIIIPFTGNSQDWSGNVYKVGKIYPGYYVTNTGDTVEGYFYHGNQVENQRTCKYYKNEMDTKPSGTYKPEDIKAYKVADKVYRSINYSGGLFAKPLRFNLVVNDGAITEFIFYSEDGTTDTKSVLHKPHDPENSQPVEFSSFTLKFAKKMSEYVADYTELSKKIAEKADGYGYLKIYEIIKEYNEWYANNKK